MSFYCICIVMKIINTENCILFSFNVQINYITVFHQLYSVISTSLGHLFYTYLEIIRVKTQKNVKLKPKLFWTDYPKHCFEHIYNLVITLDNCHSGTLLIS